MSEDAVFSVTKKDTKKKGSSNKYLFILKLSEL